MEKGENKNLEYLKNEFEGKEMILKKADMKGNKTKIYINTLETIIVDRKEIIFFNYTWQNNKLDDNPVSLGVIPIEELLYKYELIQKL